MDFKELTATLQKKLKLEKPEFIEDTDTSYSLGFLELSPTQSLIFAVQDYRGKQYFDIRTWYQEQSGEWKPTKKGIHFGFEKFNDFIALIEIFKTVHATAQV
jgi:hypothetical protein